MWASQVARLGSIRLQKPVSSERLDELSESIGSEGGDKVLRVPETKELSRRGVLNNKGGPAGGGLAANDQIASKRWCCPGHTLMRRDGGGHWVVVSPLLYSPPPDLLNLAGNVD